MPFDYFYGKQGGQYAFYRIPKLLFTDSRFDTLSTDAKLLYGVVLQIKREANPQIILVP